jgi:hypothetical protein
LGADPGLSLPKPSLPVRLVLLVAGTTLPLILFAAGIVLQNYRQDRQDATQRVLETVRSIRLVLDAEMQRMTGALQVLALTNALRDHDFEGFRRIAQGFLEQYGEGGVILVADREGRQVFSSLTSDTANLPSRHNLAMVEKVFAEKKPVYSNLFFGSVKKRLIVTVEVPVIRDNEVLYDISFSPPIEIFQAMVEQQRPGKDWTISIFDGEGTNFARVPNPQETIGKRASPSLYAQMFQNPESTVPTISLEGVPLTNLDQSLFDGAEATKRDLVDYLDGVSERIINTLTVTSKTTPVPPSEPPVAIDDVFTVPAGSPLVIPVSALLGNDSVSGGATLSLVTYDTTTTQGKAVSLTPDGSALTLTPTECI